MVEVLKFRISAINGASYLCLDICEKFYDSESKSRTKVGHKISYYDERATSTEGQSIQDSFDNHQTKFHCTAPNII